MGFGGDKKSLFQQMLVDEMGLKQLVVTARVVQSRILVIWCHFSKGRKCQF